MKKMLLATVATVALLAAAQAQAGSITFAPTATTGSDTYTGLGTNPGTLKFSEPVITGNALDSVDGATVGTWTMGAVTFNTGSPTAANPGVFPAVGSPTATFSYVNGANSVNETVTFTDVSDGSINPHIDWTDSVTAVAGSAAFLAGFGPVGSISTGDYIDNPLPAGTTLDSLSLTTNSVTVSISSGQNVITPTSIGVPEPASLGLLGTALMLLGLIGWRRYQL